MAEWLTFRKTGRLPRPFEDYSPNLLRALLIYGDESAKEIETMANQAQRPARRRFWWEAPGVGVVGSTGDALVDKWEAEFAAGLTPNLDER